jgi:predicted transcriptional regulator
MVLRKAKRELEIVLRHIEIMKKVKENQPIGIFKLAELVKLPKHKVRYSLRVLEQSGIIEPTQHGAVIREDADLSKLKEDLKELKELVKKIEEELKDL